MSVWPIYGVPDPEDVWIYVQTEDYHDDKVFLPVEYADEICAFCHAIIPETGAECCWNCVWDMGDDQAWEYYLLICAREAEIFAALGI